MPGPNPLVVKYTDENYVTKQGFFSALGSSLVERLWENVLSYRAANSIRTRLRTVSQLPITLTDTEGVRAKLALFRKRLLDLKGEYDRFETLGEEKDKLDRNLLFQALHGICDVEGTKLSEPTLRAMLTGMYRDTATDHYPIVAYRDFLRGDIGDDFATCGSFFYQLYTSISGTDELVSFYRVTDATVGQGRAGEYAKYNDIESLVANLEDFVAHDPLPDIPKAMLAMYFVDYIQPFVGHNAMLGIALAKKMLSRTELGSFALLLPLERIMLKTPKVRDAFLETAKTGDFTYAMLAIAEEMGPLLESMGNDLTKALTDIMRREFRSEMHETPVETPKPEPVEVAPIAKPAETVEVAPVEPTPIVALEPTRPAPEPPAAPSPKPAPKPIEEVPVLESIPASERTVFAPRVSLSDKEVKMAARYIVETHPDLNRQQALFFASHSTIGRYYTIQDYKKTMKVAYETARTSMDRLATSGLYKKLRIKNKYVYTPRAAGEKE